MNRSHVAAGAVVFAWAVCLGAATLVASPAATPSAAANHDGDVLHVRGKVLTPDGKPAAGATVTVPSTPMLDPRGTRRVVARATAGPDGRFDIAFKKADLSPFSIGRGTPGTDLWKQAQVVAAAADGFGLAFDQYDHVDAAGDLVLKLPKDDLPIEGRVLNLEGAPVRDVRVRVQSIRPIDGNPVPPPPMPGPAAFFAPPQPTPVPPAGSTLLILPLQAAGIDKSIVTGKDGRFRIAGLGRDRVVELYLHGPTIGIARVEVTTRPKPPAAPAAPRAPGPPVNPAMPAAPRPPSVFGAKFNYTATDGRSVEGTIRDAATHKPLAGVTVQNLRLAGTGAVPPGVLACVTDEQGHYKLDGLPKGKENEILLLPADDQPYFMRQAKVEDEPGLKPVTLDLDLHRGVVVTGTVTDKLTRQPLPARIGYTTYVDNEPTFGLPEFRRDNGIGIIDGDPDRCETRPDGTYRIVVAPGKAILSVTSQTGAYRTGAGKETVAAFKNGAQGFLKLYQPFPTMPDQVQVVREIDVPVGAEQVRCDLQLDPGLPVEITVIDVDDELVPGPFQVLGNLLERDGPGVNSHAVEQPVFNAVGFGPGDGRMLFILDDPRRIGRAAWIDFDDLPDRKLTVKLLPLVEVKGRVVSPSGEPLKRAALIARQADRDGKTIRTFKTDDKGRFSTSLPIGTRYAIYAADPAGGYAGMMLGGRELIPQQGEPIDFGDVKFQQPMR
jgi:hypothetical protein